MAALAVEREHLDRPGPDPGIARRRRQPRSWSGASRSTRPAATSRAARRSASARPAERSQACSSRRRARRQALGRRHVAQAGARAAAPQAGHDPALDRRRALELDQLLGDRPGQRLERARGGARAGGARAQRAADQRVEAEALVEGPQVVVDAEREAHARDRLPATARVGPAWRVNSTRGRPRAGGRPRRPARPPTCSRRRGTPSRWRATPSRPPWRGSRNGQRGRPRDLDHGATVTQSRLSRWTSTRNERLTTDLAERPAEGALRPCAGGAPAAARRGRVDHGDRRGAGDEPRRGDRGRLHGGGGGGAPARARAPRRAPAARRRRRRPSAILPAVPSRSSARGSCDRSRRQSVDACRLLPAGNLRLP